MPDNQENTALPRYVSVFDAGYIATSKAAELDFYQKGYFSLGVESLPGLALPVPGRGSENFWQMLISDLSESHGEKYSQHNTLSDSVAVFASGASPVEITIVGKLLVTGMDDYHYLFLKRYVEEFRARRLALADKMLTFVSKDTTCKLLIQSLILGTSVENETYTDISVSGLACRYRMSGSREPLEHRYYGREDPTPKGRPPQEVEPPRQEDPQKEPLPRKEPEKPRDPEVQKKPRPRKDVPREQPKAPANPRRDPTAPPVSGELPFLPVDPWGPMGTNG